MRLDRIFILTAISVLAACAQRGAPTGGPKDETPPHLLNTIPINETKNFKGKEITLFFDEYVETNNIQKELIISPRVDTRYTSKVRKNKLVLEFEEELPSNTTFTFNFNEGIKDITEGNKAEQIFLAFSTGPQLDTLKIGGNIRELMTQEPVEDAVVALYRANDTLDIFNSEPLYFSKTDKSGAFQIKYLKEDQYELYAFVDKNNNMTAESRNEHYGFYPEVLKVSSENDSLVADFVLQQLNVDSLKIQNSRPTAQYFDIRFNKDITDYSLQPVDQSVEIISNQPESQAIVRVYRTPELLAYDSVAAHLIASDSIANQVEDTVYLKFYADREDPAEFTSTFSPATKSEITESFEGTFTFNKPITTISTDSIFFQYDSLTLVKLDSEKDLEWNAEKDELTIRKKLDKTKVLPPLTKEEAAKKGKEDKAKEQQKEDDQLKKKKGGAFGNKDKEEENAPEQEPETPFAMTNDQLRGKVRLFIDQGTFVSVEGDNSQQIDHFYTFKESKNYGIITGKIITDHTHFIIQLLDDKSKVIDEIRDQKTYTFNMVKPGDYTIRLLVDSNNNGQWEYGNILKKEAPEEVVFYPEKITVRENWEIQDINIDLSEE